MSGKIIALRANRTVIILRASGKMKSVKRIYADGKVRKHILLDNLVPLFKILFISHCGVINHSIEVKVNRMNLSATDV